MKKILITNNLNLINKEYNTVYTDSPYIVESDNRAIHLDILLDHAYYDKISNIQKKGFEIDKKIIEHFFPEYGGRNIGLLQIREQYTHIYKKIFILFKLLNRHQNDEVTIAITSDEVYNDSYDTNTKFFQVIDRFVNVYYWIAKRAQIKDIKLVCKNIKNNDLMLLDQPIDSWFLRIINIDKKVLIFNFLKKFFLIKERSEKIYIYKKSNTIREIEPYLYSKGISFVSMPDMNVGYKKINNILDEKKLKDILDIFFENNILENTFKLLVFDVYKKLIKSYLEKKIVSKKNISKLNSSIKFVLTNTISDFDSLIFAKQLQDSGYQIINVMHYIGMSYTKRSDNLEINECSAPDMTLCYNNSEKKMFNEFDEKSLVYPISSTQDTKITRLKKLQRIYVNRILKINDKINVFYPSVYWPLNNASTEGISPPDLYTYNFEKKMIKILSAINKRSIYKRYSRRGFVDTDKFDDYAKSFNNIKVIKGTYDFRYISSIGDIFILGGVGYRSTANWMLKYNKPIIYLHTNNFRLLNEGAKNLVNKIFFTVDLDRNDWENNLTNLLNKPYKELMEMWKDKQIYRDKYDEEWLLGMKSHAGKLGSKYIKKFMTENIKNESY
jgi:hypothetical protein